MRKVAKKASKKGVTNEDILARIDERFETFASYVMPEIGSKEAVLRVEHRVSQIDVHLQSLSATVDAFAKQMAKFDIEYHTLVFQTNRYEKWFRILADKVGVKLDAY
jgi:hypothetical protein